MTSKCCKPEYSKLEPRRGSSVLRQSKVPSLPGRTYGRDLGRIQSTQICCFGGYLLSVGNGAAANGTHRTRQRRYDRPTGGYEPGSMSEPASVTVQEHKSNSNPAVS